MAESEESIFTCILGHVEHVARLRNEGGADFEVCVRCGGSVVSHIAPSKIVYKKPPKIETIQYPKYPPKAVPNDFTVNEAVAKKLRNLSRNYGALGEKAKLRRISREED